jgi:hypothetical protein
MRSTLKRNCFERIADNPDTAPKARLPVHWLTVPCVAGPNGRETTSQERAFCVKSTVLAQLMVGHTDWIGGHKPTLQYGFPS